MGIKVQQPASALDVAQIAEPQTYPQLEEEETGIKKQSLQIESLKDTKEAVLPILVFSCNRPAAISRSLKTLLMYRPDPVKFPIIVSQDCNHEPTASAIKAFADLGHVTHLKVGSFN